jgi:hypothetical protein
VLETTKKPRPALFLAKLILLAGSLLMTLVMGELVVRLVYPELGRAQHYDAGLGWSTVEYQKIDVSDSVEDQRTRMLFLGDSFLAGAGVKSMADRFPVLLGNQQEDRLETRIFAAGGWGTDQQLLAFKEKGAAWRPDVVILAFYANNDISNILANDDNYIHSKPKPYFMIEQDELVLFDSEGNPLDYDAYNRPHETSSWLVRSHLVDFVKHTLSGLSAALDVSPAELEERYQRVDERYRLYGQRQLKDRDIRDELFSSKDELTSPIQLDVTAISAYVNEDFELNTYQWQVFEGIVGRLNEEVEAAGGELLVMLLPTIINPRKIETMTGGTFERRFETPAGPVTIRSAEPRERLAMITQRLDIPFLDPTRNFIDFVTENGLLETIWPDVGDRHSSEVGHGFLANWLSDRIDLLAPAE